MQILEKRNESEELERLKIRRDYFQDILNGGVEDLELETKLKSCISVLTHMIEPIN